MNKIVNGVANDYEFPMYYESNIKTSRDKDSVIAMTYVNQEKEIERLNNIKDKANKIINTIFEEENWYKNYDYNDLVNKLKEVQEVLGSDKD